MEPNELEGDKQLAGMGAFGRSASAASDSDDSTRRIATQGRAGHSGEPMAHSGGSESGELLERVGRYEIIERLGQGGMATVFKAYDRNIDRTIAIKLLHASLLRDAEYRSRFLREAKAAGVLNHQNIVTVHDVGEVDGQPYIAMELLEGTPLNDLMAEGVRLSLREVVEIGIQLARALDYAHGRGVVHRDIKPSNIVRLKGTNNIKVTDFGIAHLENSDLTQRTRIGDVLGTPQYMSPEQTLGQKVDARSDLFSAGVVLYQLLTGERPFEADSVVSLMYQIAKEEPRPIEQLRSDLPVPLRRVVQRLLKKQPDKRFQSGHELSEALVRVIRELDESESRPRIVPLRVKWSLIMALVVAVTMAVTATVVIQRQYGAMMDQVIGYGASLSRFMATESAVPALSEDWVAIEVFLQEAMKGQEFHGITVVDHGGVVRAGSDAQAVGQLYRKPEGAIMVSQDKMVTTYSFPTNTGTVLDFEAPITFQGKEVGRLHLGIPERPLSKVARLSMLMMAILVVTTVAAVIVATYFLAYRFSESIKLLADSMAEIGKGRSDYRIAEKRNDEFGQLYRAFDDMAEALQKCAEPASMSELAQQPSQGT